MMPASNAELSAAKVGRMLGCVCDASSFLKVLGNEQRLMILCHLVDGEKGVGELEDLVGTSQASVSQCLGRLKAKGLVTARKEGRSVYYSLANEHPKRVLGVLYEAFCGPGQE